ncbi:MAG: calcium-binding protein [Oculatellaceae cyanobacterium bins.114]|nr:calcium-binding protein [Oculatellaceae cyanobacterium bins.114]
MTLTATDNNSSFNGSFTGNLGGSLATLTVDPALTGNLQLDLALNSSLGDSARLPSIGADLELNWGFGAGDGKADGRYQGQAPTVDFNNVRLNIGSFFRSFAEPVFGTLNDVLEPIAPIVDILQTRLPVLDTFGRSFLDRTGSPTDGPDGQVTLLDLVKLQQPSAPLGFIGAIAQIIDLTETINDLSDADGLPLSVGGFQLGAANDIRNSGFSLNTVDLGSLSPIAKTATEILNEVSDLLGDSEAIQDFIGGVETPQGPQFPILTDPNQVFKLLLGQNAEFFQYTLPRLEFEFGFDVFFPILGPLGALIEGNLNAAMQLAVGYDSRGLQQFLVGGDSLFGTADDLTDPSRIFNGFYIDNRLSATGPGGRQSGAELNASLNAYGAINIGIASAGVGGGIGSNLTVLLNDPTPADNKVYFDEFSSCIFDPVKGAITAGLNAFIKFGIGPFSYTKRFNIASTTLLSFEAGCSAEEQSDPIRHRLALTSGTTLQLAMGSLAGDRRINNIPGTDIAETFKVDLKSGSPNNATLTVLAFGARLDYSNIALITANGGNEDDSILITAAVLTPAELSGNGGNDQLYGGSGGDRLEGNEGDDALYGGAGNDSIFGGAGVDLLDGGAGADLLDGGDGPDAANDIDTVSYRESAVGIQILSTLAGLVGVGGDAQGDRLIEIEHIEGSRFADTINGDGNNNTLEGLEGNDILRGGNGDDILLGGSGRDRLEGGNGQDWTSYLTSSGAVTVNLATGTAFGGDADGETLNSIESLQGSVFGDRLSGNASNNELDGFYGNDILVGRGGADTLEGGDGEDWASYSLSPSAVNVSLLEGRGKGFGFLEAFGGGDGRDDTLRNIENLEGSRFDDILAGDNNTNILKGLAGNDTLQGNGGNDTLLGGAGGDTLDGGDGIDLVDYDESPLGVVVNLKTGVGSGGDAQGDSFIQSVPGSIATVEHVRGSKRADSLTGDDGNNILDPNLSGGGIDQVSGGAGDDQLRVDYSFQDTGGMFGGFGFGYIIRDNARGATRSLDQYASGYVFQDRVNFGSDIERFYLRGSIYADSMFGGAGADVFLPGGGNDFVSAGLGDDQILGEDGIDTLSADFSNRSDAITLESFSITQESQSSVTVGGKTISRIEIYRDISTGSGGDRLTQLDRVNNNFNTASGNDIVNPGLGFDTVTGGTTPPPGLLLASVSTPPELDVLVLDYSVGDTGSGMAMSGDPRSQTGFAFRTVAPGSETVLDAIAFSQFERLDVTGTSQDDVLFGSDGYDTLRGQAGSDRLVGNRGNDELLGGDGNDILIGTNNTNYGSGEFNNFPRDIDILNGGVGADTFVLGEINTRFYSNAQAGDYGLITDFNLGEGDRIQLQGIQARYVLVTGSDSSGNFTSIYWTPPPIILRAVGIQDNNDAASAFAASNNIPADGELIGVVRGTTGLTLDSPAFQFV